jgi:hypothetical protein
MPSTVYIETTVPSAHVSTRTDPGSLHRREITQLWWREQLVRYEVAVSDVVLMELQEGAWPGQSEAIALVQPIKSLIAYEDVRFLAARYIAERLMPAEFLGDAAHLALSSLHEMEYLLTWNIRHLANPNKVRHLTVINRRLGLFTPQMVTPEMLWLED